MVIFECANCNTPVFFENTTCENCGNTLGFNAEFLSMFSKPVDSQFMSNGQNYQYCANHQKEVCNWIVAEGPYDSLCQSCLTNRTVPNLNVAGNLEKWSQIEIAKHRLVYSLIKLKLPIKNKIEDPKSGLFFDFMGEKENDPEEEAVKTGHADGIITLNIDEADPVHREYMKRELHEPYRTLIGHFRHEIGHYYWQILVSINQNLLEEFRNVFGSELGDYGEALQRYYKNGPPSDWNLNFISEYATSHPWEDWAETWAHYIHMIDTLETAYSYGISIYPMVSNTTPVKMTATFDPYVENDFDRIVEAYVPLSSAVNSINRSMGQPDLYPFTFNKSVVNKLRFIHSLVRNVQHST